MTSVNIEGFIEKVRLAIDELMHVTTDDFYTDLNKEIKQALLMAVRQLSQELPVSMLTPTVLTNGTDLTPAQRKFDDGSGWVVLPDDFLRLVEFRLNTWLQSVFTTIEPTSDEAKHQASLWGRGTPQKPRAMEAYDAEGNHVLRYWTAGKYRGYTGAIGQVYDHTIQNLTYIPSVNTIASGATSVNVPIKEGAMDYVVYRAASLVLTGKKETALAQQFWQMSQAMTPTAPVVEE